MELEWEDDSPQGRKQAYLESIGHHIIFPIVCVLLFHFVHLALFLFRSKLTHLASANQFSKLFWKSIRVICCLVMQLCYTIICALLIFLLWTFTTFSTSEKIFIFTRALFLAWCVVIIWILIIAILPFFWKLEFFEKLDSLQSIVNYLVSQVQQMKFSRWIVFSVSIIALLGVSLFFIGSFGLCLPKEPTYDFSTTISRMISKRMGMDDSCPDNGICHVYLLVPNDLSTQMQVVFHSTQEPSISAVRFGVDPKDLNMQIIGRFDMLDNFELTRYVSSVVLNDLKPGTSYYFQAVIYHNNNEKTFSEIKKFRTAPIITEDSDDSIHYVVASDVAKLDATLAVANQIAKEEPLFLAIGGDIAYENGYDTCYCRWDWFFRMTENQLITPKGYTIPMLASIGNHESRGIMTGIDNIPFFLDFFPYADSMTKGDEYLDLDSRTRKIRSLYHSHTFGNELLQFIVLDSGYGVETGGEQRKWLEETLKNSQHYQYRAALYHAPLYPGRRNENQTISAEARKQWLDLFDKYELTLAYENHDHVYKRTHPLKQNRIVPQGTIYLGDGCWGVEPRKPSLDRWYIDNSFGEINFYLTTSVYANWMQVHAKNSQSDCLDDVIIF